MNDGKGGVLSCGCTSGWGRFVCEMYMYVCVEGRLVDGILKDAERVKAQ